MIRMAKLLLAGAMCCAASACMKEQAKESAPPADANGAAAATPAANHSDPVASAESAAPAAIAKAATIMSVDDGGAMKELRAGTNGWTCMPDSPATPGPDPMCFNANAGKWVEAWLSKKTPPPGVVGLMYMLEGGTDASNTDPYAKAPTSDNDWIKTGPHLMVVGSQEILAGLPSGAKPDTNVPYVMWAGTPYAHVMIPTGPAQ